MLVAQISDLHITTEDNPSRMVNTTETLQAAVEVLNSLDPKPDCVLATGDLVDNGTDAEYRILFGILGQIQAPVHVLPGNHDDHAMLRLHLHHQGMLRADEPGHLGTVVDGGDVRIVLVDTTDRSRHDGCFPADRERWLRRVLSDSTDRPTLVAMHHPPFATGIAWMDRMGIVEPDRARFEAVIRDHSQVKLVVFGHVHRAISTTWGPTMLTICPSTAHQVGLSLGEGAPALVTKESPSLQIHHWTGTGFVTNTRPLEVPVLADISQLVSDWTGAKQ